MKGLLLIERMVLESLQRRAKNFNELQDDTGLERELLRNVLKALIQSGPVANRGKVFHLDKAAKKNWIKEANAPICLKSELKELFVSLINQHFREEQKNLKVEKIYLTDKEEQLLLAHLKSIEIFFDSIRQERSRRPLPENATKEQKVLVWGLSNYSRLVDASLSAV